MLLLTFKLQNLHDDLLPARALRSLSPPAGDAPFVPRREEVLGLLGGEPVVEEGPRGSPIEQEIAVALFLPGMGSVITMDVPMQSASEVESPPGFMKMMSADA